MQSLLGVHDHDVPTLRLLDLKEGSKYKFSGELTPLGVVKWLVDFQNGKLKV